jgi:hypothetical protein
MAQYYECDPIQYYSKELSDFKVNSRSEWILSGVCPFHPDTKSGNFCINRVNGAYKCHRCNAHGGSVVKFHAEKYDISYREAIEFFKKGDINHNFSKPHNEYRKKNNVVNVNRLRELERILKNSKVLSDSSAELAILYFKNRGIKITPNSIPNNLYFYPKIELFNNGKKEYSASLISKFTNLKDEILTLQKTHISPEGEKLNIESPKKFAPSIGRDLSGGSVKLYKAEGDTIGICEGIETGLAIRSMTNIPVWACLTADLLSKVELPKRIKKVRIYADNDLSQTGIRAAVKAYERLTLEERDVSILIPPLIDKKSTDWLDVYYKELFG